MIVYWQAPEHPDDPPIKVAVIETQKLPRGGTWIRGVVREAPSHSMYRKGMIISFSQDAPEEPKDSPWT